MEQKLTHVNEKGEARMVDVSEKPETRRTARAECLVRMRPETLERIVEGRLPKGDVFAVARVAGILAAKRTDQLIPLCHPLPLESVTVELSPEKPDQVRITAEAVCVYRTGAEMEALTAATVAGLTLYDMCKAVDRDMELAHTRLLEKSGGKSGHYIRADREG